MYATIQLSNDGGCPGPRGSIETSVESAVSDAIDWAEGQIGHPHDCILVCVYEDNQQQAPVETYQIEYRDGSWECV